MEWFYRRSVLVSLTRLRYSDRHGSSATRSLRAWLNPVEKRDYSSTSASEGDNKKGKFKSKRPKWEPGQRAIFMTAIRGMTPSLLLKEVVFKQRQNPVRWSDQNLASAYGVSVEKMKGMIRIRELAEEWEKNNPDTEQHIMDDMIRVKFGTFSVAAMLEQKNKLERFKRIIAARENKYSLPYDDPNFISNPPKSQAKDNDAKMEKEVETEPTEEEKERIFSTGLVTGTDHTVTVGFITRQQEYRKKRLEEAKDLEIVFI